MRQDVAGRGRDRQCHDDRTDAVREVDCDRAAPFGRGQPAEGPREVGNREPGVGVAHRCADEDLHVDQRRRQDGQPRQGRVTGHACVRARGDASAPAGRSEQRQRYRQAKEDLRQAGVRDRDRRRQEVEDGDAAQRALQDDRGQRGPGEPSDPAAVVRPRNPERQADHHQPDGARDEPVAVLVEDPSHHLRQWEAEHEVAVGVRPVGDGEARVGAGDQPAHGDQQQRRGGDEKREPVEPGHALLGGREGEDGGGSNPSAIFVGVAS